MTQNGLEYDHKSAKQLQRRTPAILKKPILYKNR